MKNIPPFPRGVLNILLYIFYVFLVTLFVSFAFPVVLNLLGKPILDPSSPIFAKIQIAIIILVFFVSIVLRKYVYLSAPTSTPKTTKKPNSKKKEHLGESMFDDEMKIYIDKEIK